MIPLTEDNLSKSSRVTLTLNLDDSEDAIVIINKEPHSFILSALASILTDNSSFPDDAIKISFTNFNII